MDNGKYMIFTGITLLVLISGIFAVTKITQSPQTTKSQANENSQVELEMINPRLNSKLLGLVEVKAQVKTTEDVSKLSSILNVGSRNQSLTVSRVNPDTIILSGEVDTTKLGSGNHTFEISLFNSSSGTQLLMGSTSVLATVVLP